MNTLASYFSSLIGSEVVTYLHKHPELEGQIRHVADRSHVRLGGDPAGLVTDKLLRRVIAWSAVLKPLQRGVTVLERLYSSPKMLAFLYRKVLASFQLMSFGEGSERQSKESLP